MVPERPLAFCRGEKKKKGGGAVNAIRRPRWYRTACWGRDRGNGIRLDSARTRRRLPLFDSDRLARRRPPPGISKVAPLYWSVMRVAPHPFDHDRLVVRELPVARIVGDQVDRGLVVVGNLDLDVCGHPRVCRRPRSRADARCGGSTTSGRLRSPPSGPCLHIDRVGGGLAPGEKECSTLSRFGTKVGCSTANNFR